MYDDARQVHLPPGHGWMLEASKDGPLHGTALISSTGHVPRLGCCQLPPHACPLLSWLSEALLETERLLHWTKARAPAPPPPPKGVGGRAVGWLHHG